MSIDHLAVWQRLPQFTTAGGSVAEVMGEVVAVCEESRPHPDWTKLRDLDWDGGAADVRDWLQDVLDRDPPDEATRGLWFGVHNPVDQGRARSDLHLAGTDRYDPGDDQLDWVYAGRYDPRGTPRPACLEQMYEIAYDNPDGLQNDAEWPLALVFGSVAVARALSTIRVPDELRRDAPLGVAAGFEGGEFLFSANSAQRASAPGPGWRSSRQKRKSGSGWASS